MPSVALGFTAHPTAPVTADRNSLTSHLWGAAAAARRQSVCLGFSPPFP